MISDDPIPDDRIDNVTVRHLRDLRRTQDLFLDLLKRQTDMTGRVVRDLGYVGRSINELKSDLLLQENRSITAAENDEFFRRELASIKEAAADSDVSFRSELASIKEALARIERSLAGR